jgi:multidrug resistance protein
MTSPSVDEPPEKEKSSVYYPSQHAQASEESGPPPSRSSDVPEDHVPAMATEPGPDLPNSSSESLGQMEELRIVPSGPAYSVFGKWQKRYIVAMATLAAFISPTSANIYFPALNPLQEELGVSSTLINLTITSYMIFQGLSPTIIGDFSDMAGRRPAYILAFIVYLGANIGLALQNSYAALLVLRCVQSAGSSGAIALGFGVVADVATSAERGEYVGIVGAGTMLGPALGPVIGGILAQFLGWRSIFWFLTIISALFLIPYILSVPETARKIVGNGSIPSQGWNMTALEYLGQRKQVKKARDAGVAEPQAATIDRPKLRFPNPLKTIHIIMEKDVAAVLFYNALIYTAFYMIMASLPQMFQQTYGFNDLQIGLCYIPFGVGCASASWMNGKVLDFNYRRVAGKIGFKIDRKRGDNLRKFPIERARLEIIFPMICLGLICYIIYGWVMEINAPLAAPLVLHFFIGVFLNGSFNIMGTLLVDLYPQSPATATAANNLVRCFLGAGGTGIIDIMVAHMGRGWCFTFIALVCFAALPLLWVELRWGPKWREERHVRLEEKAHRHREAKNREENKS